MNISQTRGLAALLLAVVLSACSSTGDRGGEFSGTGEKVIATNLIFALAQIPALNPLINTVQMSPPNTSFGTQVASLLADAGYGIQTVDGDTGEFFVRYREETVRSELGLETSFLVAIGDISVTRSFDTANPDMPVPLSPLYIAGASEFDVQIDDTEFEPNTGSMTYAVFDNVALPQVFDFDTQTNRSIGNDDQDVAVSGVAQPEQRSEFGSAVRRNIFSTDISNYSSLFAEYDDIRSEILVFGNDSMRLGADNKRMVQSFVDAFKPETDLVSIIGCSHGKTSVANGNAVLAVGRANRVKEAFLFAGLEGTKVLEEGCWAGDYHGVMPRRGVVLTLKRRAG